MCGIAGFWTPAGFRGEPSLDILNRMTDQIRSRGPDARGSWLDQEAGLALGHRRLAVIELSPAGAQPMASPSGRYVLVFNGEIYNHLEMRESLSTAGHQVVFRGHSDTETLLAAIEAWGIEQTLSRAVGMFALACWDGKQRALFLTRDRMGEKPLYYGWQGSGGERALLFGSELKAVSCHPAFEARIDRKSVEGYLARLCVPGSASIWQGVAKVPPGAILRFDIGSEEAELARYWSIEAEIEKAREDPVEHADEGLRLLHDRLREAVRAQLLADVPLGAFLSGGIDSSLVVALMQEVGEGTAKTFSIGFEEADYNEAEHARAVAQHLGTEHHELVVSAERARGVIPKLPRIYDEPFADSSQIPTFLVSELARSQVTVALSGDGADELFGGYTRYTKALRAWARLNAVPPLIRALGSGVAGAAGALLPDRVVRASAVAGAENLPEFYRRFTDHTPGKPAIVGANRAGDVPGLSPAEQLMWVDQLGYLPDDILVKVDRAAMAVSLEVRAPYLDHRVVSASWRLASSLKRRAVEGGTVGKWPLRQLLDRYVPRALIERPKQGFGVPIGDWLRGPLKDWADDLLAHDRMSRIGLVEPGRAAAVWSAHRSGRANHAEQVWSLAMLSAWHEEHVETGTRACAA